MSSSMCGWPRGDLLNGAASLIGRAGVEAGLECSTDGVQVAVARGREGPFADAVVDGGLERPPACETVLAGDEQLGVGQLCGDILGSHSLEALEREAVVTWRTFLPSQGVALRCARRPRISGRKS